MKPPYAERLIDGGDFVVWNVLTLEEAAAVLVADSEFIEDPEEGEFDFDVEPVFSVEDSGLMRKNVQEPGGDYGWMLSHAPVPGHGARHAMIVNFQGWEEIVYESDPDE